MLTEQETADMCAMVDWLDKLTEKGGPGSGVAWYRLKRLAETTGDEWEDLVRSYIARARCAYAKQGESKMNEIIGDCLRNPRKTGHCLHSEHSNTTGGHIVTRRCCWCGETETLTLSLPDHGIYANDSRTHL
jgi:hypothetical protein